MQVNHVIMERVYSMKQQRTHDFLGIYKQSIDKQALQVEIALVGYSANQINKIVQWNRVDRVNLLSSKVIQNQANIQRALVLTKVQVFFSFSS